MLTKENRDFLEASLIHCLYGSNYNMEIITSIKNDSLFKNPSLAIYFSYILKFYYENGYAPESPSHIMISLFDSNQLNIIKDISSFHEDTSGVGDITKMTDQLIDDNISHELNRILKESKEQNITSYDRANYIIDELNKSISKAESYNVKEPKNIDIVENLLQSIKRNKDSGNAADYIKTGIKSLDNKIIGIPKKHITIIAARPGMGKTAFMLQLMRNVLEQGYKVGIISIEMETEALLLRNLSAISQIDSMDIENGSLSENEFKQLVNTSKTMLLDNYIIEDSGYQSANSIKAKINTWKALKKIDIVFIDYLTLISTKNKYQRFDLEIGDLTGDLRTFAKETGIPIVILSQLNRKVEERSKNKPMLSDLRESGSIEQDAKTVLLLHRPSVYGLNPFENNQYFVDNDGNMISEDEYLEIHIAKARNGKLGTIPLRYIPKYHKFLSASKK